jgi:hypothetical protein
VTHHAVPSSHRDVARPLSNGADDPKCATGPNAASAASPPGCVTPAVPSPTTSPPRAAPSLRCPPEPRFSHHVSLHTRVTHSPPSHARNRRTGWLRHARRAGAPRRSQGGSLRLPARFVVFLHDQLTREGARQGAPSTALRIGTHTKHVFPHFLQANHTSAPSSVARVGAHHAPNTRRLDF